MSRISRKFKALKAKDQKALITYIMAGDPSLELTAELIPALDEGGADIIELGVPFSDPLADGPVIQRAAERAITSKTSLVKVFNVVNEVRKKTEIPIVIMTYYNIIFNYDEAAFVKDAKRSGVDGVIIPDLPPEEGKSFIDAAKKEGLDVIFLLAPTSHEKRISIVSKRSKGFIYYVSLTGVTGVRTKLSDSIKPMIEKIRAVTKKPVAVGFGVSTAEQAREVASYADGVVIGSAIVRVIEENTMSGNIVNAVRDFVNDIKRGMHGGEGSVEGDAKILGEYLSKKL